MKTINLGTEEVEITEEIARRINDAIKETERHLAREMKYSEDLRYKDEINRLEAHIKYLKNLVA